MGILKSNIVLHLGFPWAIISDGNTHFCKDHNMARKDKETR